MPLTLNLRRPLQERLVRVAPIPPPPDKEELEPTGGRLCVGDGLKSLDDILKGVDLKKKKSLPKNNIKFIF